MYKPAVDPNSRILLTDPYETTVKRIRNAVTDSISGITFDPVARPGTSNLLTILSACTGEAPAVLAERYAGSNHDALNNAVALAVDEALRRPRAEFTRFRGEKMFLGRVARDGAETAQGLSYGTMRDV